MLMRGWIGTLGVLLGACTAHGVLVGRSGGGEEVLTRESTEPGDADEVDVSAEPTEPVAGDEASVLPLDSAPDEHCERLAAARASTPVDPQGPGGGMLLTARGGTVLGLPLSDTRFDTTVTGTIAATTVTQTFVNDFDRAIEAVYTFPLPHDGAVDRYVFRFAGREIAGVLKRRADAVAAYEAAQKAEVSRAYSSKSAPTCSPNGSRTCRRAR